MSKHMSKLMRPVGNGNGYGYGYGNGYGDGNGNGCGYSTCSPNRLRRAK